MFRAASLTHFKARRTKQQRSGVQGETDTEISQWHAEKERCETRKARRQHDGVQGRKGIPISHRQECQGKGSDGISIYKQGRNRDSTAAFKAIKIGRRYVGLQGKTDTATVWYMSRHEQDSDSIVAVKARTRH